MGFTRGDGGQRWMEHCRLIETRSYYMLFPAAGSPWRLKLFIENKIKTLFKRSKFGGAAMYLSLDNAINEESWVNAMRKRDLQESHSGRTHDFRSCLWYRRMRIIVVFLVLIYFMSWSRNTSGPYFGSIFNVPHFEGGSLLSDNAHQQQQLVLIYTVEVALRRLPLSLDVYYDSRYV